VRRNLLNFATLLSLLLCAAACVVWVLSRFVSDRIDWASVRVTPPIAIRSLSLRTTTGGVLARWDRRTYDQGVLFDAETASSWRDRSLYWDRSEPVRLSGLYPADSWAGRAGFRAEHSRTYFGAAAFTDETFSLAFPLWVVVVAGAALPAARVMRRRAARRRARAGQCPGCGYDLRATPERCPECGALPRLL